jgi:hypothetical protein
MEGPFRDLVADTRKEKNGAARKKVLTMPEMDPKRRENCQTTPQNGCCQYHDIGNPLLDHAFNMSTIFKKVNHFYKCHSDQQFKRMPWDSIGIDWIRDASIMPSFHYCE